MHVAALCVNIQPIEARQDWLEGDTGTVLGIASLAPKCCARE